tara:strand:+ start:144 stop:581 length:438 start_codon:yes stop_codon:yes gene_type:complete
MEIRKKTDGSLTTDTALKAANTNTSWPTVLDATTLDGWGYEIVYAGTAATTSGPYQTSVRDGVEQKDGKWYEKYKVETATDTGTVDSTVAKSKRAERNNLLKDTDYYALSDVTMSSEMAAYRKALRDLPTASGWPHTHTVPTKPS